MAITICVIGSPTKTEFWNQLELKYKDNRKVQFLYRKTDEECLLDASTEMVFITPYYAIPTYETAVAIENLKPGISLSGIWHDYCVNGTPKNKAPGSYSINTKGIGTNETIPCTLYYTGE